MLSEIAETADITEAVRKIWTIIDIFRKGLSSENSKKYKSIEEASLYVGAEVVRYIMEKSNKEQWMTLAMSSDPCRYGYTASSFAESYNNSIGTARRVPLGNALVNIINKEHNKVEKLLESLTKADNGKHVTAMSSIESEYIRVEQMKNDSYKYVEEDDVYELHSNGTITRIMMVDVGDGKMNFFCQCGYPQNHLTPCRHCIKLLTLINRENMNKDKIYELVDDILKVDSYRKLLNESRIILPNMSFVRTT